MNDLVSDKRRQTYTLNDSNICIEIVKDTSDMFLLDWDFLRINRLVHTRLLHKDKKRKEIID